MNFLAKLLSLSRKNKSLLCVGLDPDLKKIKENSLFEFNKKIIDQTAQFVCTFKLQSAFYEAEGFEGIKDLKKTIDFLKNNYQNIPIILDAKRADIGATSLKYVQAAFDYLGADAVTVNPYLGFDSLLPFFERNDKGIIVLCRTTNPGAADFQSLKVDGKPLFLKVAEKVVEWNERYGNLLMVVGATWPEQMKEVRAIAKEMTFLVPGIGTQGGDLKQVLENGLREDKSGLIISVSSGIIYDQEPQEAARKLRDEINKYR